VELRLKSTRVQARIDGLVAQVDVFQRFENRNAEAVKALYAFPLPTGAAVNGYTIKMAGRELRGMLRTCDAAAKARMLRERRAYVFTHSVVDIPSMTEVEVHLRYDLSLEPHEGLYAFVVPTVAGPRFVPYDTDGASVAAPEAVSGGGPGSVSIEVLLDAGLPVLGLRSVWHGIRTKGERSGDAFAGPVKVELAGQEGISDRDFRLEYRLAGKDIQATVLTQKAASGKGGHFLLMVEPPARSDGVTEGREILLLLDQSGSMSTSPAFGLAQEAARRVVSALRPLDRLQIVGFSDIVRKLSDTSLAVTKANRGRILAWIDSLGTGGGSDLLSGLQVALKAPRSRGLPRHVVLLTDGFVGNGEGDVFRFVHEGIRPGTTLHCFGTGGMKDDRLLEDVAEEGHGLSLTLERKDELPEKVDRFLAYLDGEVMRDISLDWGGLEVADLQPVKSRDLFLGAPLVVAGRIEASGKGILRIKGTRRGKVVSIPVPVELADADTSHPALPRLWARRRLAHYANPAIRDEAKGTDLALRYELLSPWTSFGAVLDSVVNPDARDTGFRRSLERSWGEVPEIAFRNPGETGRSPGTVDGFLDKPLQLQYIPEYEGDGLSGLSMDREFKEQMMASDHACSPIPSQAWDLAIPFGKELRVQVDLLKALQAWVSGIDWPTHAGAVNARLRLLVEPSGRISQATLVPGREPTSAERLLLERLIGQSLQDKAEGFMVLETNVSIGSLRCLEAPGEIEKRP